ncbi:hypothetical protein SCHPADRAFT_1001839 [Schizopora paradoxa]|uniref:BTB domain-containing protein n=1 Tax=Schizopora paradoxa TaxID=27342 RepID=A0A0H2RQY1_9AGAM|nr:hypothetical protein SCHPADRAFT_1001839 [Schizopora paradoxa]
MDVSEDAMTPALSSPKRHETLWLADGNVVLATKTYLFRVHKSVLAMRSSVFRDMFGLPSAHDEGSGAQEVVGIVPELCDGIPMVTLEDEGRDVEHLLKTIYESRYYNSHDEHHTVDKVCALLKLSSKYNFQGILVDVIEHLSRIFPTRLEEYEGIFEGHPFRYDFEGNCHASNHLLASAIQAGVDDLFPALYYACANEPFSVLRRIVSDTPAGWAALERLVEGQYKLKDAGPRIMSTFVELTERCVYDHNLGFRPFVEKQSWHSDYCYQFFTIDLGELTGSTITQSLHERVCADCLDGIKETIEQERVRIWKELPQYFGLGNWGSVRAKLRARIEDRA